MSHRFSVIRQRAVSGSPWLCSLPERGRLVLAAATAVVLGVGARPASASMGCADGHGDVVANGDIDVADVECMALAALAQLSGGAKPGCLGAWEAADLNCDASLGAPPLVNVADISVATALALELSLGAAIDADDDACPDRCEGVLPCEAQEAIGCGDIIEVDAALGAPTAAPYACPEGSKQGVQVRYYFKSQVDTELKAALSGAAGGQWGVVIAPAACAEGECLASGVSQASAVLDASVGYVISVLAPAAAAGTAALTLSCTGECPPAAVCGPDHCGEVVCNGAAVNCGGCPPGATCSADNLCVPSDTPSCAGFCGADAASLDGCFCDVACFGFGDCCADICAACGEIFTAECEAFETCGDGLCDPAAGENCVSCGADCGCGDTADCVQGECVEAVGCAGYCGDESPDGCFCDASCFGFGDCCADICAVCSADLSAECAAGTCGDGVCSPGGDENCETCDQDCACADGTACVAGQCQPLNPNSCANQCGLGDVGNCFCDASCFGFGDCCADVCAACTGDFEVECALQQSCGNGVCEPGSFEDCTTCAPDCVCGPNLTCVDGLCLAAVGCIGSCGEESPDGCFCDSECFGFGDCCDNICDACASSLAAECGGANCGDGVCDAAAGESCDTCVGDCACGPGTGCVAGTCKALVPDTCVAQCGAEDVGNCYCDTTCFAFGDCCADICEACAKEFPQQCAGPDLCGDGICDANIGESCGSCVSDCACGAGLACVASQCVPAFGGCAGVCGGESSDGCYCDESCFGFGDCCENVCIACAVELAAECAALDSCGNGLCDPDEDCATCEQDCGCPLNTVCTALGECLEATLVGCAGFCGGEAAEGCFCDDSCFGFGDCCADVCDECGASFPNQCK
jgi:hypothetical protein